MKKISITFATILLMLTSSAFSQMDKLVPLPAPQANIPTNTSLGFHALANNTTGNVNTALGLEALFTNTTGFYNTAIGKAGL